MTTGEPSRLDRIESILEQVVLSQRETQSQIAETRNLVDSNARAIEANSAAISELKVTQERVFGQIDGLARETLEEIVRIRGEADEDRKLIVGLQTENRRILERLESHLSGGHGSGSGQG